jgi:hypothetical protein
MYILLNKYMYRYIHILCTYMQNIGPNAQCRLALASCLVQYGGANFDAITNTKAVSSLLEGKYMYKYTYI